MFTINFYLMGSVVLRTNTFILEQFSINTSGISNQCKHALAKEEGGESQTKGITPSTIISGAIYCICLKLLISALSPKSIG